jgi:hypothetical protein
MVLRLQVAQLPADHPCVGELEAWYAWMAATVAPRTRMMHSREVARFLAGRDFRAMTEDDVLAHLATLGPGARHTAYFGIRSLYRWAVRRGHVDSDPSAEIPRPKLVEREARALTRERYRASDSWPATAARCARR